MTRQLLEAASLSAQIGALVPEICSAAQAVYDTWEQDGDGYSEEFGAGGACDEIASEIGFILSTNGIDFTDGGQDGDDHAYVIAYNDLEAFEIDIPPGVYERGSGYSWRKVPDVIFEPDHVIINPIRRQDLGDLNE